MQGTATMGGRREEAEERGQERGGRREGASLSSDQRLSRFE